MTAPTAGAVVYLALAVEAPDVDAFAVHAAEARRQGASHTDVRRAYRSWHLAHAYRRPVGVAR